MKKYSLHVLWFINVALAVVLACLWIDSSGHLRNVHWQAPAPQTVDYASMVPVLPRTVPTDTVQFIAMLDRPVFSPTRRPPPPPPPPEEKAPVDNLSAAQLSGLFQGGGMEASSSRSLESTSVYDCARWSKAGHWQSFKTAV